ncbi:gliding motility-associated C-terminal domain-containing protein [Spirosoma utsteinense]|uniref:Gliding motility-associated-like protein n=1 Tax=Spirosoma utsteinense TaxID=2585773 RepID=A0ABR6WEG3_9BACT|nr:gliding motility-associated C-terminal domain-containing protein [Spirosoma utsteinense]MBC3788261.1 gliding motility-associated-like protein [Spirosoma utsteinense]MBC3794674.1 gliding motility-associated-like protein [Spirosoma utsteinense]
MINLYRKEWLLYILTGFLLIVSGVSQATHIVGGELELQKLPADRSFTHRINMNLYFDAVNGSPDAEDRTAFVYIFRKRDNALVGSVELPRLGTQLVNYTTPACTRSDLQTRLIRYGIDVTFPPSFNDAGGYYMSWERCCRNAAINNIIDPGGAGSTFYLEFPAPFTGSTPFTNSSPVFTVARGDYACVGRPFTFDFSAKDPDGDSLTYTMVTPYNGFSTKDFPNPGAPTPVTIGIANPGPYPSIAWIQGLSTANEIPGTQPLQVNARTGLLSVTADRLGLFVFSVEVGEYRNRKLIGRVRRDFQLKVVDCPTNDAPQLLLKTAGQSAFYKEGAVLTIAEKDTNCLTLYITDINPNQRIRLTNMSGSLPGLSITPGELLTRTSTDTLQAQFCFGRCVGNGKPFTLLIRATDEGCPQGLSDTLNIRLNVIPSPNNKPLATTNLTNNLARVTVGASLSFTAFGNDSDNDNISIQAVGRGFTLAQAGMTFGSASGVGKVSSPFLWKPTCTQARRAGYIVDFIVTDTRCNGNLRDTVTVNLAAVGLSSQPPNIRTTLTQPVVDLLVSPSDSVGRVTFDVLGNDPDRDTLQLTGTGRGFDAAAAGMTFANKSGLPTLQSPFAWKPTCELMAGRSEATFVVDFVVDDRSCQPAHTDTTTVTFRVKDLSVSQEITVPNVFTPNGDGINDYFTVQNLPENACAEQFKSVDVSNRWGQLVFSSADPRFRWSGANSPIGTYYYLIQTSTRTFKGPVALIR